MNLRYILCTLGVVVFAQFANAQEPPVGASAAYAAEITAKSLHVRSGPSTNYYPVTRLSAGTRVEVVGAESGWLAITPPQGCFSLIAAKFVDRGENGVGTVNADNVRVRAGSDLSPHNYAIQLKLSKGAAVTVLGQMDSEFLKIAPPPGARLWIAGEFVRRISAAPSDAAAAGAAPPATVMPTESTNPAEPASTEMISNAANPGSPPPQAANSQAPSAGPEMLAAAPASADPQPTGEVELPSGDEDGTMESGLAAETSTITTPLAPTLASTDTGLVPSPLPAQSSAAAAPTAEPPSTATKAETDARQAELDALDKQLADEMAKPILSRDLAPLLPRYRELAERSGDEYMQAYARVRIQQIEAAQEMIEGVKTIGRLKDEAQTVRQISTTERSKIRYMPVRTDGGFDIEGELRPSALYESPIGPKRYRIVDTKVSPARTIGYVEVPANPPIDLSGFLGRRVGVRARERMLQSGDVDPLSIYVASEIVALSASADGSSQTITSIMIPAAESGSSAMESPTASVP